MKAVFTPRASNNYQSIRRYLIKVNFNKKDIIDEILSFKSLTSKWDSYGALPVEIKSAGNAIYLFDFFNEKIIGNIEDFYPNPQGTVVFEWVNNLQEKVYLEIGNTTFSYFVKFNTSDEPILADNLEVTNDNVQVLTKYIQAL